MAGIGKMRYPRFLLYNCVGAVAWVAICLWSGFFFGQVAWVKNNFEAVMVAIILISVLPMLVEFFLAWRRRSVPSAIAPKLQEPAIEPLTSTRQAS